MKGAPQDQKQGDCDLKTNKDGKNKTESEHKKARTGGWTEKFPFFLLLGLQKSRCWFSFETQPSFKFCPKIEL